MNELKPLRNRTEQSLLFRAAIHGARRLFPGSTCGLLPLILLLCVPYTACERDLEFTINGERPPIFSMTGSGNLMLLSIVEVSRENHDNVIQHGEADKLLWQIQSDSDTPNKVSRIGSIKYRVIPPGFLQLYPKDGSPPEPLEEDKIYEIASATSNSSSHPLWFRIVGQRSLRVPILR